MRMPGIGLAALFAGLLFAPPVQAANSVAEIAEALEIMRERDQRLLDIGWRLTTSNAPYCEDVVADIGLMLLDTHSFPDPDKINRALGANGRFVVQAAANGSPAAQEELASPMSVLAIDNEFTAVPVDVRSRSWENLVRVNRMIAASLASDGTVTLRLFGADGISAEETVSGTPACNAVMEPRDGEQEARTAGNRILIGSRFPGLSYPDDELAAVIAHEMAHIVFGHRAWLDRVGRSRSNTRLTEREADRLTPWLLANAGHDPHAAARFMRHWGPKHGGGLFRKRTHSGWDERAALMDEEASRVATIMDETGNADWSKLFVRDLPI